MSSPKKETMKLSEQGSVTGEALLAYLRNELSPEEAQEIEKLLHEDPFAQDALEGLRAAQNKELVKGSIISLHKKIRERAGIKEKKRFSIHWSNYAWAAVVLGLLIAVGFVMINYFGKRDERLALNEKPKEQKVTGTSQKAEEIIAPKTISDSATLNPALVANDTAKPNAPTGSTGLTTPIPTESKVADEAAKNKTQTITNNQAPALNTPKPVTSTGNTTPVIAGNNAAPASNLLSNANGNMAPSNNKMNNVAPKQTAPAVNSPGVGINSTGAPANNTSSLDVGYNNKSAPTATAENKKEANEDKGNVDLSEAMKNFNSGDYKKASGQFDKILKHEPDNADALYFGGISDYIDGKTEKSEKNFDKLLKNGSHFIDGAKWYKANILLKKGALEQGKSLLQELSNSNGSYKERAIKKLAEMGAH